LVIFLISANPLVDSVQFVVMPPYRVISERIEASKRQETEAAPWHCSRSRSHALDGARAQLPVRLLSSRVLAHGNVSRVFFSRATATHTLIEAGSRHDHAVAPSAAQVFGDLKRLGKEDWRFSGSG
jgi:hypothetical protein